MVRATGAQALVEQRSVHQGTGYGGPDLDLQGFPDANTNSLRSDGVDHQLIARLHAQGSQSHALAAAWVQEQVKADKYAEAANVNSVVFTLRQWRHTGRSAPAHWCSFVNLHSERNALTARTLWTTQTAPTARRRWSHDGLVVTRGIPLLLNKHEASLRVTRDWHT